ncbi:LysR family transcriptional regulator [Vibrio sp. HN007]|uniref:LysR family transcriptional regulator n=1 Tax=Vibrio iocasae TaxID=3098914 RepID=UPI0035D4F2AD
MNIKNFDYNSLKVLLVLLTEKNTSKAAEILGTSQSRVSRTLAKLREQLDDPLLVRESKGMKLTPRGESLSKQLPQIMAALENTLMEEVFEPKKIHKTLRIALNSFLMETFGYELFKAIKASAPNSNVELVSFTANTPQDILSGKLDAALNFFPMDVSKELHQIKLCADEFIGICRSGHPFGGTKQKLEVIFDSYDVSGLIIPEFNQFEMVLAKQYKQFDVVPVLRSENITPLLELTKRSDTIFVAPASLYNSLDPKEFSCVTPDVPNRDIKDIALVYNSMYYQSKQAKWIEDIAKKVFQ